MLLLCNKSESIGFDKSHNKLIKKARTEKTHCSNNHFKSKEVNKLTCRTDEMSHADSNLLHWNPTEAL